MMRIHAKLNRFFSRHTLPVLVGYAGLGILLVTTARLVLGQDNGPWRGKQCAVVLTYDDALNVHLDKVVPALDSLGLKGTFYLSGFSPSFRARGKDWSVVAQSGHELGNHTLYHPCKGGTPGREWVPPDYDLSRYTVRRMVDEISMANALLEAIDGKTQRTFAYPCGDMMVGDSSYVGEVRRLFPGARGVEGKMQTIDDIDLYTIGSSMINGQSGEELIRRVKDGEAKKLLVVFLFHGVGGEHALNVSLADHRKLLSFLKQNEKDILVATMTDVCEYVKEMRLAKQEGRR
jgi:peptidoglycan/xylan/chitin deacetylase (PgdA/CDA1 family)